MKTCFTLVIFFFTVWTYAQDVVLERRSLFEGEISMLIPADFDTLSQELLAIKYPIDDRPQYVLSNFAETVNITFSFTANDLTDESLGYVADAMVAILKKQVKVKKNTLLYLNHRKYAVIKFEISASNIVMVNYMLMYSRDGKMTICSLYYMKQQEKTWKKLEKTIMHSIWRKI